MKKLQVTHLLGVLVVMCLIAISSLGYYTWTLSNELEHVKKQPAMERGSSQNSQSNTSQFPWSDGFEPWINDWHSSEQFTQLQKQLDKMMGSMLPSNSLFSNRVFALSPSSPKITITESAQEYTVVVAVPKGQDVELNTDLSGNTLKISGKISISSGNNNDSSVAQSVSTSTFSQSITLAEDIDESAMSIKRTDNKVVIKIAKAV